MACPYFYPTERFLQRLWPHPARLPLGDGFAGLCHADPANRFRPGDETLQQYCNLGYARRSCACFPDNGGPDAVRFTVSGDQNGIVQIYYVLERDHRPCEHGPLEYDAERGAFTAPPVSPQLERQAAVYVEGYLRRKLRWRGSL